MIRDILIWKRNIRSKYHENMIMMISKSNLFTLLNHVKIPIYPASKSMAKLFICICPFGDTTEHVELELNLLQFVIKKVQVNVCVIILTLISFTISFV